MRLQSKVHNIRYLVVLFFRDSRRLASLAFNNTYTNTYTLWFGAYKVVIVMMMMMMMMMMVVVMMMMLTTDDDDDDDRDGGGVGR